MYWYRFWSVMYFFHWDPMCDLSLPFMFLDSVHNWITFEAPFQNELFHQYSVLEKQFEEILRLRSFLLSPQVFKSGKKLSRSLLTHSTVFIELKNPFLALTVWYLTLELAGAYLCWSCHWLHCSGAAQPAHTEQHEQHTWEVSTRSQVSSPHPHLTHRL